MQKQSFTRITLFLIWILVFIPTVIPVSAACLRKEINGGDVLVNDNVGTANNDLIICEGTDDLPTATVRGAEGNDTILVYQDDGTPRNIEGGGVPLPGNDTIIVFSGVEVNDISGDNDTTGGNNPGDDVIILHGTANRIYGDEINFDSTTDVGGNDEIHVYGTVILGVVGDGIFPLNNFIDHGGDDAITVYNGGIVQGTIYGDFLNSNSISSTGGDDVITISGTVGGEVYGDYMDSGFGGADTIVVTSTGKVGTSGVSHNIYGDYRINDVNASYGQNDDILIEGVVYGTIYGDYTKLAGGIDDIVVGYTGRVYGSIFGDHLSSDDAINSNDRIEILGLVGISVIGDGWRGNGARDYITTESYSLVQGSVYGDAVTKDSGSANGDNDTITIKGRVNGHVIGDQVDGNGLHDSIVIQARNGYNTDNGHVVGDVIGDSANGKGGNDKITLTQYAQVRGAVYGDNPSRYGGNGGNDNIQIEGRVGTNNAPTGIFGDKVGGNGGDDFIHVGKNGLVRGAVVGDDVNGEGGEDLIWIDGRVTKRVVGDAAAGGNKKDQIAIRQGGIVDQTVVGDGSTSNKNGGWDTMNIIGGTVNLDFVGDEVGGNGGNDFMAVRMNGIVGRDFIGDGADKNGGNDTMSLINGMVNGDMIGDEVSGNGGDDKMNVLVAGTVKGDLIGDKVGNDKVGGDDSIFVSGKVNGRIYGDHPSKNAFAGKDVIQTSPSAVIGNGIYGDNAKGAGKNDTFKINGKINNGGVRGDVVNGKGGNDTISVFSLGTVVGNVIGDDANGAGGNDTIFIDSGGKVTGHVWGDVSRNKGGDDTITIEGTVTGNVAGDRQKGNGTPNGGDDIIIVERTGLIQGSVYGDDVPGNGGDDTIEIRGKVNGNVLGDKVGGAGGNDVIRIFATGVVGGNVCGKNNCTNNPGDNVVFFDENTNSNLTNADTIIIAGKVLGNVIAGLGQGNSDDTVVVVEGAEIGGTVYAGDETDGDSFIYVENIINEEKTISEVVNGVTQKDGKVTVNGATYTLDDVETVAGAVGQISCFGMEYRMNKASDGCSARSQSEKDAIQWHLDNPGNDGRLPGLEGCAVYFYDDAMRIYEIMNGEKGELVAEILGDILSDVPATNELLGATADGNIALYHLASGELQVECRNLVDGKTQVRVLSDLAGTVVNAFDKS